MPIISAAVEANGWVLALTISGALTAPATNFGAYPLDPDGSPRVALALSSPGFVKSGGQAVSGANARNLVGTRALRKPIDPLNPSTQLLDETDLGGGTIRVRIALSEEVYTGDTGLTLAVLAGWRTGEGAASGIAVTNNSTLAPPVPIMRWVLPPYEVASGQFRVSIIVGTVNPVGFEPVAGVKFTATDGTTTKTVWVTALATDNTYGDNLRCYTALIDPTTATALTAGLLRIDAEVYPWVGAMRSTDTAGTRSMSTLRTDGFSQSADAPWVIGYDPSGNRYSGQWVYVDPVNGTTTAATGMVGSTLAAAKAVTASSRAKDVSTAIQAVALVNRTLAAANSQGSVTRSVDGARIILATGTHSGIGTTAASASTLNPEIPVFIEGDPDDSNPRANCRINTAPSPANTRVTRQRWRNLTIGAGSTALNGSHVIYNLIDNVEIVGNSGSETVTTAPLVSGTPPAGQINWHVTNSKVWRTGFALGAAGRQTGLIRDCEIARRTNGHTFVKNRWITKAEDTFTSSNTAEGFGCSGNVLGGLEDIVIAYNDMRGLRWVGWSASIASAALSGVSPQNGRLRGHLVLNNIWERISTTNGVSTTSDTMWSYGETSYIVMDTIIFEGNTVVGGGYNAFYSDPVPTSVADIDSQTNIAVRIRHANNATDRNASKHDDFSDPTTQSVRTAAGPPESLKGGYRPVCIGAWRTHFGVYMEGHVDFSRKGSDNFQRFNGSGFVGLRSVQYPYRTGVPNWANDKSEAGTDLGGGDYTPTASSPVLGRIRRGNSDRDFLNNARLVGGASGAIEAQAVLALSPAGARSGHSVGAGAITIALGLAGASAVQAHRAQDAATGVAFALSPAAALHAHTVLTAGVGWSAALVPLASIVPVRSDDPDLALTAAGDWLAPDNGGLFWSCREFVLFPNSAGRGGGTLNIPAEIRTLTLF